MTTPLRPIALNSLPFPSQVRLEAPGYTKKCLTGPDGRAGFPDVPRTVTRANLFIEAAGQDNVPVPGFEWYGEVIDVPPDPQDDWWAVPIPEAFPRPLNSTWHQLPKVLVPKAVAVGQARTIAVQPSTARAPLPPFDRDATDPDTHAALPVRTTINGTIPPFDDPTYHRANLWGVTLPGAPFIDGGARGLRHFWLSIPDSRDRTKLSLQDYLDLTKRILDAGLIPCHFLRSKDYDGRNPDPERVAPWVDALLNIDGIPMACHGWEASIFYDPASLRATIDHDATKWPQIRWAVHLQQGYADFGPDGEGHGPAFWKSNIKVGVKTLLYQYKTEPAWSAGMLQARGNDVSVRLRAGGLWGLPETVDWIAFEVVAQCQFNNARDGDGRISDEDTGDLKGYEALCTPGPLPPRGFGNGARYPDGRPI